MLADRNPVNYSYDEASQVLVNLGFAMAPHGGTSHRKWRIKLGDGTVVVIGLVDAGRGALKPVYIREMVQQLRDNQLIPQDLEDGEKEQ